MSNSDQTPPKNAKIVHMVFADEGGSPDDNPDHVPSENERWYDEEIAPVLLELAKRCQERDMSFLNSVEYDPGNTGETCVLGSRAGFKAKSIYAAIKSHGNVDALIKALYAEIEKRGETKVSVYMTWIKQILENKRPLI